MLRSSRIILSKFTGTSNCATLRSAQISTRGLASSSQDNDKKQPLKKATTPTGKLDDAWEGKNEQMKPQTISDTMSGKYEPFPDDKNPETGEIGGPRGPEPTRYGDWERKGRVIDF